MNTNAFLIKDYKMAKEMSKYLDYILISMHAIDAEKEEEITGVKNSFEKKIRAIKWFKRAGVNFIRVNTVASLNNIKI